MIKHKGYSLIEVVCSLALLSLVITVTIFISESSAKIRNMRINEQKYYTCIDILKKQIKYNSEYKYIKELYSSNKRYINQESISLDKLKDDDFLSLFTDEIPDNKPYIEACFEEKTEDGVLKIILEVKWKSEKRKVSCEFYKGDY